MVEEGVTCRKFIPTYHKSFPSQNICLCKTGFGFLWLLHSFPSGTFSESFSLLSEVGLASFPDRFMGVMKPIHRQRWQPDYSCPVCPALLLFLCGSGETRDSLVSSWESLCSRQKTRSTISMASVHHISSPVLSMSTVGQAEVLQLLLRGETLSIHLCRSEKGLLGR